jgi:hypothetical protein
VTAFRVGASHRKCLLMGVSGWYVEPMDGTRTRQTNALAGPPTPTVSGSARNLAPERKAAIRNFGQGVDGWKWAFAAFQLIAS